MPVYMYRREDGTTFDIRQSFNDEALKVDPQTGQHVVRLVQSAGVIFKGSGFYVNDSKNASKKSLSTPASSTKEGESKEAAPAAAASETASADSGKVKEAAPAPQSSAAD